MQSIYCKRICYICGNLLVSCNDGLELLRFRPTSDIFVVRFIVAVPFTVTAVVPKNRKMAFAYMNMNELMIETNLVPGTLSVFIGGNLSPLLTLYWSLGNAAKGVILLFNLLGSFLLYLDQGTEKFPLLLESLLLWADKLLVLLRYRFSSNVMVVSNICLAFLSADNVWKLNFNT